MENQMSLQHVYDAVSHAVKTAELNGIRPENVPFIIKEDWHKYRPASFFTSFGNGFVAGVEYYSCDEIKTVVPDVRPEGGGEYWASRGASSYDVSGFVKSKEAGERLLRFVKYVLEKDEVSTWLDYREREPEWIQFKFSAEEFDVEKLDRLSKENNDIITEEIIKICKL